MQRGTYRIIPVKARAVTVFALVSPEDYERFADRAWRLNTWGYATSGNAFMHREVLGLTRGDGIEADHINRDKLDNQRSNLRRATHQENGRNVPSQAGTSRFRGVWLDVRYGTWTAQARLNRVKHHLGCYATEERAAQAVNDFWTAHGYEAPNAVAA